MKTKRHIYSALSFVIFLLLFAASAVQKVPQTRTITHRYYNISFYPDQIQKLGLEGVEMTVTPIDAASINKITSEAARRDGNYEKEIVSALQSQKNKEAELSAQERIDLNGKILAFERISEMERAHSIPNAAAFHLKNIIYHGNEYGKDGTEVTSLSTQERFPSTFNPYKVNHNYLSVFQITFENKSSEIKKIALNDFQILSGEELLYPLGFDYFENNLVNERERMQNVLRMNMPDELIITPGQRIGKYLAVPAINPRNELLNIQAIKNRDVVDFQFSLNEEMEIIEYSLERYSIGLTGRMANYYSAYYVISFENDISYAVKNPSSVYIREEYKNIPANIYAVAIHRNGRSVKTGKLGNFYFKNKEGNHVNIEL